MSLIFLWILIFFAALPIFHLIDKLRDEQMNRVEALLTALFAAPLLLSYALYYLLLFFPKKPDAFYIISILGVMLALNLLTARRATALAKAFSETFNTLVRAAREHPFIFTLIALAIILTAIKTICWPFVSDDATCYALLGRYFYKVKSVFNYPMQFETAHGMIIAQKHPPDQMLLYTLGYMLQGGLSLDIAARSLSFYFFFLLLLYVGCVVAAITRHPTSKWVAVLVLAGTPLTIEMTIFNTLDPARILGVVLTLRVFYLLWQKPGWRYVILAALAQTTSLFTHLSATITFPLILAFMVLHNLLLRFLTPIRQRFPTLLAMAALGLSLILPSVYLMKLAAPSIASLPKPYCLQRLEHAVDQLFFMRPSVDDNNALEWHNLPLSAYYFSNPSEFWATSNPCIKFGRLGQIWELCNTFLNTPIPSRFRAFTQIHYMSLTFWLWLAAMIVLVARWRGLDPAEYYFAFLTLAGFTSIIGWRYGNLRYIFTLLPAVCILIGIEYDKWADRISTRMFMRVIIVGLTILFVLTPFTVLVVRKGRLQHMFRSDSEKLSRLTRDFNGAPDYFRALKYIDYRLEPEDHVLVFRHAAFFYYTDVKGMAFKYTGRLDEFREYYAPRPENIDPAVTALRESGCTHILTDPAYSRYSSYQGGIFPLLLESNEVELLFQSNEVCLYRIVPDEEQDF